MLRVTIPLSLFARVVRVADDGRLRERPPFWRLVAAPDRHGGLCPDLSDKAEPDSRALTLLRVARFTVFGAAKQRSSRCAAALIITSYASVSLTLVIQPSSHPGGPTIWAPHQNEPRIANHPSHPF